MLLVGYSLLLGWNHLTREWKLHLLLLNLRTRRLLLLLFVNQVNRRLRSRAHPPLLLKGLLLLLRNGRWGRGCCRRSRQTDAASEDGPLLLLPVGRGRYSGRRRKGPSRHGSERRSARLPWQRPGGCRRRRVVPPGAYGARSRRQDVRGGPLPPSHHASGAAARPAWGSHRAAGRLAFGRQGRASFLI